jgi:AcrR family transcriptional regulator
MDASLSREARAGARGAVRGGRPRREFAGEVEERILDAAAKVFLERGFEGASIEEIAEEARAGKPTIYCRFPSKEALFTAVVARKVRKNTSLEGLPATGSTTEERLNALGTGILERALASETVGLMRSAVAEARRFPDLASSVHRMAREQGIEAIARLMGELAKSDEMGALTAFAPDRLSATARRFMEMIFLPIVVRALFGEDLAALRAEIPAHVSQSVAFFLAACRQGEGG